MQEGFPDELDAASDAAFDAVVFTANEKHLLAIAIEGVTWLLFAAETSVDIAVVDFFIDPPFVTPWAFLPEPDKQIFAIIILILSKKKNQVPAMTSEIG